MKKVGQLINTMLGNRGADDKTLPRQVWDIAYLNFRGVLAPDQYYDYDLQKKSVHSLHGLPYLGSKSYRKMDALLNPKEWHSLQENKWLFHHHFSFLDFPLPEVYGVYDSRNGITTEGNRLTNPEQFRDLVNRLGLQEVVVKPVFGSMGRGLRVLVRSGEDEFTALSKEVYSSAGVCNFMSGESYLLQERVRQHPFLEQINPGILNCFRIVTFVDYAGEPHMHMAYLRLGRQGSNTDNRAGGGVGVIVDRDTGKLGLGKAKLDKEPRSEHPDTGVTFSRLSVPMWPDVVELTLKAARVFPLKSVGWDVALTPAGPVLIEANTGWEFKKAQTLAGYLQPDVRKQLAEYGITQP
jgi:hypothetical protein